ncbi:MAG: CAP domain-containing protein [Acidimicrobiales bacterium]
MTNSFAFPRRIATALIGVVAFASLLVGPLSAPAAADAGFINGVRASQGLHPLGDSRSLHAVAASHAAEMASEGRLSHSAGLLGRVANYYSDVTDVGENVGVGSSEGEVANLLRRSGGHYANMVGPFTHAAQAAYRSDDGQVWVVQVFARRASGYGPTALAGIMAATAPRTGPSSAGYALVGADGGVFNYGGAKWVGSAGGTPLNAPVIGAAATPSGQGYWLFAADGGVINLGDAGFYGSAGNIRLHAPIVGGVATPTGKGYWLVAADGGIMNYGDAGFYGSAGNVRLNAPIVGMAPTPTGRGYWLAASDGGVFNYGDAPMVGSAGNLRLQAPVVGMASFGGSGIWMVASDGGIFNYGTAPFHGSLGATRLNQPIRSMLALPDGSGYRLTARDGGVFTFGRATYDGGMAGSPLNPWMPY